MDSQNELMIMSIDLGTRIEILRVHRFDNPAELAIAFCKQQEIDQSLAPLLENNIRLNMQQILNENVGMTSTKKQINDKQEQEFLSPTTGIQNNEMPNMKEFELQQYVPPPKQKQINGKEATQTVYVIKPPNASGEVETSYITCMLNFYKLYQKFNFSDDRTISGRPQKQSKLNNKQNDQIQENVIDYYPTPKQQLTFSPQINKNSQILAQKKGKSSVYNRLFEDATLKKQKQKNLISEYSSQPASTTNKLFQQNQINFGDLQYKKGILQNEEKNQWIEKRKKEQVNEEEKQCTYHPQINEISNLIMMQKPEAPSQLFSTNQKLQQGLETAKAAKYQQELQQCTFHPQINKISQIICDEKQKGQQQSQASSQKFQQLYEEFEVKKQKQQEKLKKDQYSFQPAINMNSRKLIEGIDFYSRMQNFDEQKKQKLQIMTEVIQNQFIDKETGQELFKPIINKPLTTKNQLENSMKEQSELDSENSQQKKNVFETLYSQYKDKESRRLNMQYQAQQEQEISKAKACTESSRLVEQKLFNLMKEIFNLFDSDGDGQISSKNIDLSKIPNQILEILTPLLYELDEVAQPLTFEEFISAVERLLKTLNIDQRHLLLKYTYEQKPSFIDQQCTFKPEINKRSIQIAQKAFDKQVKQLQQNQDISETSDQKETLQVTPALFPTKIKQY